MTIVALLLLLLAVPARAGDVPKDDAVPKAFSNPLVSEDAKKVLEALKRGGDPGKSDPMGLTPLHYQAVYGSLKAVKALVEAGAPIDARTGNKAGVEWIIPIKPSGDQGYRASILPGSTPLHLAIIYSAADPKAHLGVARYLLDKGAPVDAATDAGLTPLMAAAEVGTDAVVALLLARGARLDAATSEGDTALEYAVYKNRGALVRDLLERGAKPDPAAVVVAAEAGNLDLLQLLYGKGADLNKARTSTVTALLAAANQGRTEAVRFLLGKKADPNAVGPEGHTALTIAAMRGYAPVVKLLLEAGADANAKTKSGKTALDLARLTGHVEAAGLLSKP